MSLQNLLKNLSSVFGKLNFAKIKESVSTCYYRNLGDFQSFYTRNAKPILLILASFVLVIISTVWLISHFTSRSARVVESKTKTKPLLQSPLASKIESSLEPNVAKETIIEKSIIENDTATISDFDVQEELLFLLSDNILYPTTPIEEFSNKYNKLQPLNNFAKADTLLIMKEYDSIIEQSIKDSCTFNFERRRKK